jgi:RNA polymerase sigma-70 factor, ECF subfamily
MLRAFAIRATGDAELARDLAQDALVAALAALPGFDRRSQLRTWVVGILAHKIADHFRRRQSSLEEPGDPELLSWPSAEDLERVTMARHELARVEAALRLLPERERLAMLMVDVEGVERALACHALGVTATNLRVLLHRGRHRLRRRLEHG